MTKMEFFDENGKRHEIDMVMPHEAIVFDPEEFAMLFAYALEVARGPDTVLTTPNNIAVNGQVIPAAINRIYDAMWVRFGGDQLKRLHALLTRFGTLLLKVGVCFAVLLNRLIRNARTFCGGAEVWHNLQSFEHNRLPYPRTHVSRNKLTQGPWSQSWELFRSFRQCGRVLCVAQ